MLAAGGSVGGTRRRLGPDLRRRRGGHSSTAAAPPSPVPRAVAPGGDFLEDFDAIASLRRGKAPNGGGGVVGGVAATAAAAAASSSSSASSASPSPTARGKPAFAAAPASAEATPFRTAEEVLLFSLNGGAGEGEEEGPFDDGIFVDDDEEALVVAAAMSSSSFRVEGEEEEPAFAAAASAAAAAAAAAAARSSSPAPSSASEVAVAVTFAEDDEDDSDGEDDEELLPTPSSQRALGGAAAAAAALRSELKDCSSPEDVLDVAADEVGGGLSPACATALLERLAALERRGSSSSSSASACCERSPAFLALLDEVEAAAAAGAMRPRDLAQSAWALGALRALRGRSAAAARALASAASARKLCPLLTGQDLAALFHGLGRLRADPGRDALSALGQAAASAARGEDARSLGAQSLSMVCWGLAELCSPSPSPSSKRSAAPPPGVVEALGAALAALASESSSDGSSSSPSSPSAVEASSSASSSSSPSSPSPALGPQALAVAASALARLGWQPSRAEAAAVGRAIAAAASPSAVAADDARAEAEKEAATGRGPSSFGRPAALPASKRTSFRPRELTSALFALAEWRSPSPEALSSVAQRLRSGGAGPGGERAGPVDWATAAWAFASLGGDMTEEGWRRAERELEEAAPALSVRELANAVWGLALAERFGGGEQLSGGEGRGRGGDGDGAPSPPSSSPPPSSFDVLLAAALEAAEARWPIDARAVAQIARAHASAAVLRGRGGNATLPALPQRLSDAAERRARTAAARSPLSLTHARVAALARDCGLPVSGVRVPLGVGLPVVDVALELRDDAEPGEATRVAVQVHCPREAPRAPAAGGGDASPALLGRAASAARLLRALGWLPIVVRPQDVPSSAPRAAQAAALMDCVRKGVAAALATDAPSSSGSDSFSSSTSSLPPREAETRAAALLAGSTGSMKLTAADFVSPPPSSSSDRRRTGGGRGGRGSGDGGGGGGGRGRGASGGGSGRGGGGRSSSFSSQRKPPSGSNKFSPGGGWGEVS